MTFSTYILFCLYCNFIIEYLFCRNYVFQEHKFRPAASNYKPGKDFNHDKLHEGIFLQSKLVYCSCGT